MKFKKGDKVVVSLGQFRGGYYSEGLGGHLPMGMLIDGTVATIVSPGTSDLWATVEGSNYSYPQSLLRLLPSKKQRLLDAIKDFK